MIKLTINIRQISFILGLILLFSACKSRRDTWLKKKYQNLTARYNSYYHGKKIINETIEDGRKTYKDNFDEIIDLYAYGTPESLKGNIANMDKIQKKAAFLIKEKKKSKWIDDTYFLVGQSYFFKGDMDAAISTFQYVSSTYKKNPKLRYDAQVWIVKSYFLQGKLLDAESAITNLINDRKFYEKSKPELYLVAGAVLSKLDKNVEAIKYINLALKKVKDKESKRRMYYVLGQLYTKTNKYSLAAQSYKKVTKMNPPYEFNFRSKLNIVDLLGKSKGASYKRRKRILNRMLKDDKNLDNMDVVYSYLAKLELSQGNTKKALEFFTLSAGKSTKNKGQKAASYEEIANYYYKEGRYLDAKKYYDSTQQLVGQLEDNIAKKYDKGDNFNNLLDHLVRIQREDSLLALSSNPIKLEQTIDNLIKAEKDKEKQLANKKELDRNFIPQKLEVPGMNNNNNNSQSTFPFYNTALREKGFTSFIKRWGKRSLVDNWRIYSMSGYDNSVGPKDHTIKPPKDSIKDTEAPINVKEERKKYYKDIPFSADKKRNSLANIEESLFEAGKIYMEMDRTDDAIVKFNRLLKEFPKSNYSEGVLFYLYKIYNKTDTKKADKYKNKLELLFPKSRFLDIIYGKKTDGSEKASKEITELYLKAYKSYSAKNYNKTLAYKKEHNLKFAGSPMQIKFDYLAALSLAKMGRKAEAKALLIHIKDNWPTTKIGKRSAEHIEAMNGGKKVEKEVEFTYLLDKKMEHLYISIVDGAVDEQKIKIAVADFNKTNYSLKKVYVVTSVIDDAHKAIIIKGFENVNECMKYKVLINSILDLKQKFNLTTHHSLIINKKNLSSLIKTKKVDEYVKFFGKNY